MAKKTLNTEHIGADNSGNRIITCASRKRGNIHKMEFGGNVANAITTINTDSMVAFCIPT